MCSRRTGKNALSGRNRLTGIHLPSDIGKSAFQERNAGHDVAIIEVTEMRDAQDLSCELVLSACSFHPVDVEQLLAQAAVIQPIGQRDNRLHVRRDPGEQRKAKRANRLPHGFRHGLVPFPELLKPLRPNHFKCPRKACE